MVFFSDYFRHRSDCRRKQAERSARIASLPAHYTSPITPSDRAIYAQPIAKLVASVHAHTLSPLDILRAYGKAAIKAHDRTNCLTEILFPEAEAWATNTTGPLAGIPVSLKDTIHVAGFDTTVGYSKYAFAPQSADGTLVTLLKQAGAIPFVKTNIPISLLSFESTNDVWGRCTNPHNPDYSPGGSTGGEAALLALGGSRIGVGSDVAGSVRAPAHFSGCYSLRCSTGRWPKMGNNTSMPGQEGIPSVFSPMARTLDDLTYFTRALISQEPWRLDHTVHPLPWRPAAHAAALATPRLRIGVLHSDGVVPPTPACARALADTVAALRAAGHIPIDISPPAPLTALLIATPLLLADGTATFAAPTRPGERMDPGAARMAAYAALPRFVRALHVLYIRHVRRDPVWADLLAAIRPHSAADQWALVARREAYKAQWHAWWAAQPDLDFLLTPPNATPAVPHGGMAHAAAACGYTFLFNLLDYAAGIVPVTRVDAARDAVGADVDVGKMNGVARGAWGLYDAEAMQGLPVGVQVVGRRLEEEKVLGYMQRVEEALERWNGGRYALLEVD